ncbi:hypothetical protein Misp01_39520 [Microtetraspora sp. NBRC 13810]|uniref:hypothetical protein n=1 Tax=Microtetraspora sp. NBRC 13810 TaxID=3030990 RepID=UPI0025558C8F|nr:hypothetical protein [Microtetraspora sp. NBRC 13810]GLW08822.1 hypothetical protein Misp01_39520 [Microtetraspora sp. NBRC 13810]
MTRRRETWYRRLLLLYPRGFRDRQGEELVGTLMLATHRFPIRETAALLTGAFAAHATEARRTRTPWWADGLHLAVLALTVTELAAQGPPRSQFGTEGAIVLVLLLLRGWVWPALPLALFVFTAAGTSSILIGVVLACLAVLALWPGTGLTRRSWGWSAIPAFFWLPSAGAFGLYAFQPWALVSVGIDALLAGAALWATVAARDARWALASAIYVGTGLATFQLEDRWGYLPWHSTRDFLYWGLVTLLAAASAVAARRTEKVI